jgi:hypothetical protein
MGILRNVISNNYKYSFQPRVTNSYRDSFIRNVFVIGDVVSNVRKFYYKAF